MPRVVLITGCSTGIGRDWAWDFVVRRMFKIEG
jgi:NAD(P)-dependent dehydrogenase (short-subunit alcohol dehydrogenase family)